MLCFLQSCYVVFSFARVCFVWSFSTLSCRFRFCSVVCVLSCPVLFHIQQEHLEPNCPRPKLSEPSRIAQDTQRLWRVWSLWFPSSDFPTAVSTFSDGHVATWWCTEWCRFDCVRWRLEHRWHAGDFPSSCGLPQQSPDIAGAGASRFGDDWSSGQQGVELWSFCGVGLPQQSKSWYCWRNHTESPRAGKPAGEPESWRIGDPAGEPPPLPGGVFNTWDNAYRGQHCLSEQFRQFGDLGFWRERSQAKETVRPDVEARKKCSCAAVCASQWREPPQAGGPEGGRR